jgi:hypothetical protein
MRWLRLSGLAAVLLLTGCASAELEMTNADLARSRLLFVHEERFAVMAPPLFAGSGELDAHRRGDETYERKFQAKFPARQEDWLASFEPLDRLPGTLEKAKPAPVKEGSAPRPLCWYLVPLEGVQATTIGRIEGMVREAGFECVANQPGDATRLPMPPRGTPPKPANQFR